MPEKLVDIIEVSVDDFIGATNNSDLTHLLHLSSYMLHGIHAISPPSEVTQHRGGDSVSERKINKGDGTWAHEKEILVWIFNGQDYTLRLLAGKKTEKSSKSFRTSGGSQQKHQGKSQRNFQVAFARIVWNPREGRDVFTYTGRTEGHKPVVARHTRPNTISPILGGDY